MTTDFATYLVQNIIWQALTVVSPFLFAAVAIGLVVSVVQTVTSLQDQSLSFVPKLLSIALLGWALIPWFLQTLTGIIMQIWQLIPQVAS